MLKKDIQRKKCIPEELGNSICGVWPYIISLIFNAIMHIFLLIMFGINLNNFVRLFMSFVFFIYPFYYVADVFWSMRPSVCDILSGKLLINRKYYMNVARKEVAIKNLVPVTISIPVYTENNEVIFETLIKSIAALKRYYEFSNQVSNIIVSDDGIAVMLNGKCNKEKADYIVKAYRENKTILNNEELKAAERINFYRKHNISYIVRPKENRAGLFKKASNLNYTLRLGNYMLKEKNLEAAFKENSPFKDGYAEGNIITNEIILLLDKDSGINERVIEAIVPEFGLDDKLAYIQCATNAANIYDNYYSYATGHQINNLFHNIWPCKALQGYFVPLVGHNVFLRKSILEKSGLWSENKVSEDFDKAIAFYNMGYHGKYAQIKGLEFSEYVSRTFMEETGKQRRYSYGLFEMIFDGTIKSGKTRKCDVFYMILYFFSAINEAMLIPTVLFECYFGNVYILWAGFLFCNICFIILPRIRGMIMYSRLPKEYSERLIHTTIIAFSFVGHSFSILAGACRYFANKIKENTTPFPSTSVDKFEYCFSDGIKLITTYFKKNKSFILINILCIDRGIYFITRKGINPFTFYTYCYILFFAVFIPFLLTPQLFSGLRLKLNAFFPSLENNYSVKKNIENYIYDFNGSINQKIITPVIVDSSSDNEFDNSDIKSFLSSYNETLQETILNKSMPDELITNYIFESCIRKDDEDKKEIYLLRRRKDNVKVLLRVTKNYPEEDAVEEARLLKKLNHPSIPKVYDYYEKDEKKYILREYIEGSSLYDIIKSRGALNVNDIYKIMLKLTDILKYLHFHVPPIIHRDIKPQNIIISKDGSIYLIDFGIARLHKERRKQDTSVVLTLDYASPEQYGFAQTTPLSDIYSLGVVMLFMATGNTIKTDLESQIVNNKLRYMIERCIDFNPKSRFQKVEDIQSYITKDSYPKTSNIEHSFKMAILFISVIAILGFISYYLGIYIGKIKGQDIGYDKGYSAGYADSYELMPAFKTEVNNLNDISDNAAVNMFNGKGSFVASDNDTIFYINNGDIYKMSDNGAEVKLMVKDINAEWLSYYNGWLYYLSGTNIMQTNIYNLKSDILYENIRGKLYIVDGSYYIRNDNGLYLLDIDRGNIELLNNLENHQEIIMIEDKLLFLSKDKMIFISDINGENLNKVIDGNFEQLCLFRNVIFALSKHNETYRILKIDEISKNMEILTEVSSSEISITDSGIYFIDDFDDSLNVYSLDGKIRNKISKNRARDFNVVGDWIFYHNIMDNDRLWCVRLDGTNDHPINVGR